MDPNTGIQRMIIFSPQNEVFRRGGTKRLGSNRQYVSNMTSLPSEPATLTEVVDFVFAVDEHLLRTDDVSLEARQTFTLAKKKMRELLEAERVELKIRGDTLSALTGRLDRAGIY